MNPEREDKRVSNTSGGVVPQVEAGSKRQSLEREHVATGGADIVEGQVGKLRTLFPEVFVEGKIDLDKLRATLGAAAESGPGRFNFSWAGKDNAVRLLQTPGCGTLIPHEEESIEFDSTRNVFIEGDRRSDVAGSRTQLTRPVVKVPRTGLPTTSS